MKDFEYQELSVRCDRETLELRFGSHLFTKKRGLTSEVICRMKTA